MIRSASLADAASIARIYNFYVRETIVTFEEEAVSEGEMAARLRQVEEASLPWLAAEEAGEVSGYAYATAWKSRRGYRFSAEVTVYVDQARGGRGIGSALYERLLPTLQALGIHAAMGGIALPNAASVALHEKFGFDKVAHFREVGLKFDRWIDVGYWEKVLLPVPQ
ncbi:MAG: N-acetyltransferase family protein [Acidobacteriota bacterium]|nr:N-acetyltransferase family protein [Acidobacteriota bacterium]